MRSRKHNSAERNGPQMTWAIGANGEPSHISEVERGLKCRCTCPMCRSDLVAKKGKVQEHHFAHAKGAECAHAVKTALHLAAKDILAKRREIVLPSVEIEFPHSPRPDRHRARATLCNRIRGSGTEARIHHPGRDRTNQRARATRRNHRHTRGRRRQTEEDQRPRSVVPRDQPLGRPTRPLTGNSGESGSGRDHATNAGSTTSVPMRCSRKCCPKRRCSRVCIKALRTTLTDAQSPQESGTGTPTQT